VDVKNDAKNSSVSQEQRVIESLLSLAARLSDLTLAMHQQNETMKTVVLQVLNQNAQLIEALGEPAEDDEESGSFDMSGNPIKIS
jgi:hypothetical protein